MRLGKELHLRALFGAERVYHDLCLLAAWARMSINHCQSMQCTASTEPDTSRCLTTPSNSTSLYLLCLKCEEGGETERVLQETIPDQSTAQILASIVPPSKD
jgi:hypothetical protein